MNGTQPTIQSLGEIALRVENLERMQRFYTEVPGLTLMRKLPHAAFLSAAPDYGGHTQVLVLFDRSSSPGYPGVSHEKTPLDHFALTIDLADYAAWKKRLEDLGLEVLAKEQRGFFWRFLFFDDPEGNVVELVCYDKSVPEAE